MQILTTGPSIRSIHGTAYSRLWNSELLETVAECAGEFSPPQTAMTGATGLYCGEQDLFCFLIDPAGWIEIGEEAFAPGFFVWNSEVGRRSLGIIVLSAVALLERTPHPDEHAIRHAIAGNICRCTGYDKIVEAIAAVAAGKVTP